MSEYIPIGFMILGIAIIVLASFIARDLNNFKPSDRFIACQQTVLSLGSMSLAFGIMSAFLQQRKNDYFKVYLGLGTAILIGLLISIVLMFDEINKIKQFNNKPLKNALFSSMIILAVFLTMDLGYIGYVLSKKKTDTRTKVKINNDQSDDENYDKLPWEDDGTVSENSFADGKIKKPKGLIRQPPPRRV